MYPAGPNWRDRYYATDLDVVLASVEKMNKHQCLDHTAPRYQRSNNTEAKPNTKQTQPESTPTPSSIRSQTLIGSSPFTVTSPASTHGFSPALHPSSTTSPEAPFSAPTPSSSSANVTYCPHCPTTFTGSPRNRNSNLKRHMRTTHGHGNVVGLMCTVCGRTISRSDNLGKHMRKAHPEETGTTVGQAGARKRRRSTEEAE